MCLYGCTREKKKACNSLTAHNQMATTWAKARLQAFSLACVVNTTFVGTRENFTAASNTSHTHERTGHAFWRRQHLKVKAAINFPCVLWLATYKQWPLLCILKMCAAHIFSILYGTASSSFTTVQRASAVLEKLAHLRP